MQNSGTTESLMAVTYGGGQFVAVSEGPVGGYTGTVLTSPDGVTWTQRGSWSGKQLYGVAYGGGQFVAVGWDYWNQVDVILTSRTGTRWTARSAETTTTLWGVTYGSGQFVAVGGSGVILTASPEPVTLTLRVGSKELVVEEHGERTTVWLDAAPEVPAGTARTFLPIRPVVEALGGEISWLGDEQRVEIQGTRRVVLWIGRNTALIDGAEVPIDETNPAVKPYVAPSGRTMLPLRFVAEALGAGLQWIDETRTVIITYPKP
jgi:hypothetical protein